MEGILGRGKSLKKEEEVGYIRVMKKNRFVWLEFRDVWVEDIENEVGNEFRDRYRRVLNVWLRVWIFVVE